MHITATAQAILTWCHAPSSTVAFQGKLIPAQHDKSPPKAGARWRSVLCSCSAALALHPSGRGWGRWQRVVNHGDRSDSCRSKKLRLWDKALHPSHLGGSSFSLALLVGVAIPTAGAWSAACERVQALHLLLGCEYLLATVWLHWKQTERRISCKATAKILLNALPWWEGCWLTLPFPQVLTATGLNRYTCMHSAHHFLSELIQAKTRFPAWHSESCVIQGALTLCHWKQEAKGGIKKDEVCFGWDVLEKLPGSLDWSGEKVEALLSSERG